MRKKEKKLVEKYFTLRYSPCGFRKDTAPKKLTNHNARNHGPAASQCLSGGLCGRQGLPYSH